MIMSWRKSPRRPNPATRWRRHPKDPRHHSSVTTRPSRTRRTRKRRMMVRRIVWGIHQDLLHSFAISHQNIWPQGIAEVSHIFVSAWHSHVQPVPSLVWGAHIRRLQPGRHSQECIAPGRQGAQRQAQLQCPQSRQDHRGSFEVPGLFCSGSRRSWKE